MAWRGLDMHFLVVDGGYDYWERAGRVQRPICLKAELFGRPDAIGVDHELVMQISGAFTTVLEGFDTYNHYQLRGPQLVALVGSLKNTETSNPILRTFIAQLLALTESAVRTGSVLMIFGV